jgi:hypothetical protein
MSIPSPDFSRNGGALLAAALEYARRDWSIIPVIGKRPAVASWTPWQTRRAGTEQLRQWFADMAATGIAVVCGAVSGGLTVRDYDQAGAYDRWASAHADLAATLPTVQTARGFHVYHRSNAARILTLGDGELRGAGYCLAPPSRHPSGSQYRWVIPLPDGELPIIDPTEAGLCNREDREGAENTPDGADGADGENGADTAHTPNLHVLSAPSPFSAPSPLHAIEATLPRRAGERNRRLFDLARQLKALVPNATPNELRPILVEWHQRAFHVIGTKPFLETWADFIVAWGKVKYPAGQAPVDAAFSRALHASPPATAIELYPGETGIVLLATLCRELEHIAGAGEFFLDTRTAGRLLNVDHSTAWRWLKVLCADGVLRAGATGSKATRKASRFSYTGD